MKIDVYSETSVYYAAFDNQRNFVIKVSFVWVANYKVYDKFEISLKLEREYLGSFWRI